MQPRNVICFPIQFIVRENTLELRLFNQKLKFKTVERTHEPCEYFPTDLCRSLFVCDVDNAVPAERQRHIAYSRRMIHLRTHSHRSLTHSRSHTHMLCAELVSFALSHTHMRRSHTETLNELHVSLVLSKKTGTRNQNHGTGVSGVDMNVYTKSGAET